jgi:ubiquinol-cytochrome c reductase cytochrome c subunit
LRRLAIILGGLAVLALLLAPATGQAGQAPVLAQGQPASPTTVGTRPGATVTTTAGGGATTSTASGLSELEASGRQLYLNQCASCHGADLNGVADSGPSLRGVGGAAAVDFVLRTGRMPLPAPDARMERGPSRYTPEQIRALVAYVGNQVGDAEPPAVRTSDDPETIRHGRELYLENCSACHGVNGAGAAIGGGYDAPPLLQVAAIDVAEAMKVGPGRMPVFAGDQYPEQEVNAIASYVLTLGRAEEDPGGFPIGGRGPVAEGFVAWVIGLGLLVFASRLIGTRTPKEGSDAEVGGH